MSARERSVEGLHCCVLAAGRAIRGVGARRRQPGVVGGSRRPKGLREVAEGRAAGRGFGRSPEGRAGGLRGLVTRHRHRDGTRHSSSLGFGTWTGRTLTTRSDREGKLCRHQRQRDGAGASDTSAAGAVGPATEPVTLVCCELCMIK